MLFRFVFVIAVYCLSLPSTADEKREQFSFVKYGNLLYFHGSPQNLYIFGAIEPDDSFELRKALRSHDIKNIVLASPGGNVWEGLQMAGTIFDKKLLTYIPQNSSCLSACSFLFFAGGQRIADGELGVHQAYSADRDKKEVVGQTQFATQFTVSEIIGFLNEFGTPSFVYEKMFQDIDMYYFTESELQRINIPAIDTSSFNLIKSKGMHDNQVIATSKTIKEENPEKHFEETPKDNITSSQNELNRLGCSAGIADGVVGKRTKSALDRFNIATGVTFGYDALAQPWLAKKLSEYEPIKDCFVNKKRTDPSFYAQYKVKCISGSSTDFAILTTDYFDLKSKTGVFYIDWQEEKNFDGFINFALKNQVVELRNSEASINAKITQSPSGKIQSISWSISGKNCSRYSAIGGS
jgi:hypothetical protein